MVVFILLWKFSIETKSPEMKVPCALIVIGILLSDLPVVTILTRDSKPSIIFL